MAETRITEKYEFKTDIISSYSGYEQRIKTRQIPRHYVSYDYSAMDEFQAQWLRSIIRYKQNGTLFIPMWQNMMNVRETYPKGYKAIYTDTCNMFSLRNVDVLLFFSKDSIKGENEAYQINMIDNSGAIGLKQALLTDKIPGADFAVPMIRCAIQPADGLNYLYSNGSEVALNFEDILYQTTVYFPERFSIDSDESYLDRNERNLPVTHNGYEVLLETPSWIEDNSMTLGMTKNSTKLDNDTGRFYYDLKSPSVTDVIGVNFLLDKKEQINNMIRFFHRRSGMLQAFYYPSWVNDIEPYSNLIVGQNFFYTDFDLFSKYYNAETRKKKIVVFTKDYKAHILDIVAYAHETVGDRKLGKILLSSPIESTIMKDNIDMISYLNLVRFNDDSLKIDYETTSIASIDISLKEVYN